jgi:cellulose synthase/poly-beta-1,6-N-acetylglucosamine synthase-like glycosyltransferase
MPLHGQAVALLFAGSATDQFVRSLLDTSFAGIHQLDWFDWALLIPYFVLLSILAIYGMHRYETIRAYFKNKHKIPVRAPKEFDELPPVTIQLPLFNERFVVDQLLESASKVDYPRHLLQIQVLDDSTDDTHPYAQALVARYRAAGLPIEYLHRSNRHGFKAGALQEGLKTASGEFVAVFDADFLIPADFLLRTVHFFTDPQVGVVQTRWSYTNSHYNVLTEVETILLDGHFILEHSARAGENLFFNFNGTAGIIRKSMIDDAGGWQHDTLTEDSDLSYRAQLKGWRFVYVPSIDCQSELPVDVYGFQVQQSRWAKGLMQVAIKLLPSILRSNISRRAKIEAFMHLTPNISYPMMIVVSALMLPVMVVRFYMGWMQMLFLDLPLIVSAFWSISAFYLVAQQQLNPRTWKRSIFLIPALIATGVGLTVSNTRAVLEAFFGVQTAFARTPKYAISGQVRSKASDSKYRRRSGWVPFVEIGMGTYFLIMIAYAIDSFNFFAIPFLLLFVGGYYWFGFATLWQEYQGLLRYRRAQREVERLETAR